MADDVERRFVMFLQLAIESESKNRCFSSLLDRRINLSW